MKKILSILVLLVLCSCSSGIEFSNQYIDSYNKEDYKSISKEVDAKTSFEYYEENGVYKSIYTDSSIYASDLKRHEDGYFSYYYDYNGNYYDAFGNKVPYALDDNIEIFKVVVSSKSSLYERIVGNKEKEDKLYIMHVGKCNDLYLFKFSGDTHFWAENVISASELDIESYLMPMDFVISCDFDNRFTIVYEEEKYSIISSNDENETKYTPGIKFEKIEDYVDDTYQCLIGVSFANGSVYGYYVKEVNYITNDFTFVVNDKKYKAMVVTYKQNNKDYKFEYDIDYVPIDLKEDKENDMAYLLCGKIDKDGNISNKYYTLVIDNGKPKKLTSDITPFEEGKLNVLFDGNKLTFIREDVSLVALTDDVLITLDNKENEYVIKFASSNEEERLSHEDYILCYEYMIDGKYYFYNDSTNEIKYVDNQKVDLLCSDVKFLSSGMFIYKSGETIYFGENELTKATDVSCKIFYCNTYKGNYKVGVASCNDGYGRYEYFVVKLVK